MNETRCNNYQTPNCPADDCRGCGELEQQRSPARPLDDLVVLQTKASVGRNPDAEGYRAAGNGASEKDNPYQNESNDSSAWLRGWWDATEDAHGLYF